jgi:hypothetical protein
MKYFLRPYRIDKYYVATDYFNNNSTTSNTLALYTTFKSFANLHLNIQLEGRPLLQYYLQFLKF